MVVSKSHVCTGHFPAYALSLPASALPHLEQQLDWNEIPLCILVHLMQEKLPMQYGSLLELFKTAAVC